MNKASFDPVDPESVAMSASKIEEARALLVALRATGKYPAIQVCVRRRGQIVLHEALGDYRPICGNARQPVDRETRFLNFSISKSISATALHILLDRGIVHVDDPVCWYIPEFGQQGKQHITLRHILTHSAGIPMIFWHLHDDLIRDWDRIIAKICAQKPWHFPGRRTSYHIISGGYVIAEIIRRADGRDIATFLREEIREPLGFDTLGYGIDPSRYWQTASCERVDRLPPAALTGLMSRLLDVDLVQALAVMNRPAVFESVIPAGNIVSTAEETSRFFQMLVNGGQLGERQILSERQVQRATAEQVMASMDWTLAFTPQRYGLGFILGRKRTAFNVFGRNTQQTFGHLGFMRQLAWGDRARQIAACFLTTGIPVRPGKEVLILREFQDTIRDACQD
ncbi:MAG: beta-lactamase family protein [Bradymonadaceae bacterium]|nr:beta-lactamase family protein [Lujinxingiaceae bacterium]